MAPALLAQRRLDLSDNRRHFLIFADHYICCYEKGHERQYDDWGSSDDVSLRNHFVLSVLFP